MTTEKSMIPAFNEDLARLVRQMRGLEKKSPAGHCMDAHVIYQIAQRDPSFAALMKTSICPKEHSARKKRGPYKKRDEIDSPIQKKA